MIAMVGDLAFKAAQLNPHLGSEVLARTPGVDRLVLTACHPLFSAAQRLVVTARLASTSA